MKPRILPVASVHGRFQPLHNQHLEYLLEAKKRCQLLWVGITQFNIRDLHDTPNKPHRADPLSNPLTYYERIQIIEAALLKNGIEKEEFSFIPFPIEEPNLLKDFLPISIPIFTTICDKWNQFKIQLLVSCGYEVVVLYERKNDILRSEKIRYEILNQDPTWKEKVPDSTVKIVSGYHLRERMEAILDGKNQLLRD